ncbi:nucleotidyltransferase family protein [Nocardioides caldifontis]|uniref:nucleotidyltransferase family protein n=1 Tax=Nocardioides caldifontis TaxID=2588938 RepID=UPI0011DF15C9|nr:nucleotidyltransferase family protein [Nocardioides caldifontis]
MTAAGLLLAAGAGRRMGRPKALLTDEDGRPLAGTVVERLREAGCASVTVVVGAAAEEATALLRAYDVEVVVAQDWATGMGASMRRGLEALAGSRATAALVTLVDLPDVGAPVMARVLGEWRAAGSRESALLRATYAGRPGHPVLIGRTHWPALRETLEGDAGARRYLADHAGEVVAVPCDDLATGEDVDRPEQLRRPVPPDPA